jgi:hypothetical protein
MHLRHYLHSVLAVSWLVDSTPGASALLSNTRRNQPMPNCLQKPAGLAGQESPISGSVARLLDRLWTAIAELGYEAVIEDLSSPELIGGEESRPSMLPSARPHPSAGTRSRVKGGSDVLQAVIGVAPFKAAMAHSRPSFRLVVLFAVIGVAPLKPDNGHRTIGARDVFSAVIGVARLKQ